eukprot:jgi/Mesvir1/29298/Mv01561-RA.1
MGGQGVPEPINDARVRAKPEEQPLGLRIMQASNQWQDLGGALLDGGPQGVDDEIGVADRNAKDVQPTETFVPAQELRRKAPEQSPWWGEYTAHFGPGSTRG